MSESGQIGSGIPQEKLLAPIKPKTAEKIQADRQQQVQAQPTASGMQWMAQNAAAQQAQPAVGAKAVKIEGKAVSREFEIQAPSVEDMAILSTTVKMKDESVMAVTYRSVTTFLRKGFNLPALEESYREVYKKSKSHNLLLERFMANIKFSVIKGLFSALGVSGEEQEKMQKEVREQALNEIDSRLKNEWAYSKAMLEIVG
jgi:hypothetical protein